jgi:hypothetical protein
MLVLVATMSLLGRWQWDVSASQRGGLQNLLYAIQWWFMAGMIVYGWWRLLHDDAHRPKQALAQTIATPAAANGAGAVVVHSVGDDDGWVSRASTSELIDAQLATPDTETAAGETDEDLARYNEYLAWLNQRAQGAR